ARLAAAVRALGERLQKESLQATNAAVATALTPMLSDARCAALVAPVLAKAAENQARIGNAQAAAELRFKLVEYHLRRNDTAAARAEFKLVEDSGKKSGLKGYNAHYGLAQQYLKTGWVEDALREFGIQADDTDASASRNDMLGPAYRPEPAMPPAQYGRFVLLLLELPPARRYEILKTWSLPTSSRKMIRYYIGLVPGEIPPAVFGARPPFPVDEPVSTMLLMVDAARAAGKIEELTATAKKLAAEKVENAGLFEVLVYLAQGKGKEIQPAVKAFAAAAHKRMMEKQEMPLGSRRYYGDYRQPVPFHWSEFLFAKLCLADPASAGHGEALLAPLLAAAQAGNNNPYQGWGSNNPSYGRYVQALRDRTDAVRAGAATALSDALPPHWFSATARAPWFAQDAYVVQPASDQASQLVFDTPLAGTFEFSVDASLMSGSAGYGGVVFSPQGLSGSSTISAVGASDMVYRPLDAVQKGLFNRITVQVAPGKVRCLVDGKLFFEDVDPPPTSPWLMLSSNAGQRPVFRRFEMSGKPEVLAEVKLSAGDYLEGWTGGGNRPTRLMEKDRARGKARDRWGNPFQEDQSGEREYTFWAKDGEILGRKLALPAERPVPNKLAYFRPLRPGETIR
ncbi:MAG TPA: DUF1581 domain-containing protein, partial [Gemmataceae bacterium]|nr:DUF1581 domain-containing protein [Gemmataceae bacterium]